MNSKNHYALILASGTGVRLWPISTTKKPKQFLDLLGVGKTFIQLTYDRLKKVVPTENIFILTTEDYKSLVKEQLPNVSDDNLILEPRIMKTAACNLLAAKLIYQKNKDAKIIVSPSTHLVYDSNDFEINVMTAFDFANEENLVILGAEPTRPDSNLSYVQFIADENKIKKVKTFIDKPSIEFAETFINSGDFLWNTGILVYSVKSIINSFIKYSPSMNESLDVFFNQENQNFETLKPIYNSLDVLSINNAILDKAKNVFVIPTNMGWNDFGTWDTIDYFNQKTISKTNLNRFVKRYNTENTFIYTNQDKGIVVDGLKDFIVIDSENGLLICPKENIKEIKSYVNDLKFNKGEKYC